MAGRNRGLIGVLLLALAAGHTVGLSDVTTGCWVDSFSNWPLSSRWEWLRENPRMWELRPDEEGSLAIITEPGGILYESNDARNLLVTEPMSDGFDLVVAVKFQPTENYHFAGLIAYQDDDSFVQFGRAFCGDPGQCVGSGVYFDIEEAGVHHSENFATQVSSDVDFLRLLHVASYYVAYHSTNGDAWNLIGIHESEAVNPTVIGIGAWGGDSPVEAEFLSISLNPDQAPTWNLEGTWTDGVVSYRIERHDSSLTMIEEASGETYALAYTGSVHAILDSAGGPTHIEGAVQTDAAGSVVQIELPGGISLEKEKKGSSTNVVMYAFPVQAVEAGMHVGNPSFCSLAPPLVCEYTTPVGEPALLVRNRTQASIGLAGIVESPSSSAGNIPGGTYSYGGYFAAGHNQQYACGVYGVGAGDSGRGVWGAGNRYGGTFGGGDIGVVAWSRSGLGECESWTLTGAPSGVTGTGIFAHGPTAGGYFSGGTASIVLGYPMCITSDPSNPYSDIVLKANDDVEILLDADGAGPESTFVVRKKGSNTTALLVRDDGTVTVRVLEILGGADVAESFPTSQAPDELVPGTVLVIDPVHEGNLKASSVAYDRCVAGVVSGAGTLEPGVLLEGAGARDQGVSVALSGQTYCLVDASYGSISPGDLLTTSATPGYAMKVSNHTRAQGAILGKAMTSLSEGTGLVLVLVTLQ
jgi:hypothetical protein